MKSRIVRIDCKDEVGLINKFTQVFLDHSLNIISQDEFVDKSRNHFFMRSVLDGEMDEEKLSNDLNNITKLDTNLKISGEDTKKIIIFVSKEAHCLGDLLIRNFDGSLGASISAVISNHKELGELVDKFSIPFHFISHAELSKEKHEGKIIQALSNYSFDCIVLAKYMRILSKDFVLKYNNKIINIHHSFLPAFIGAKPYHQAYDRGVKLIGATAHFVNEELDAGPIISQDVAPVSHDMDAKSMISIGRDVEKVVLANALELVLDERVFVNGKKTVVF